MRFYCTACATDAWDEECAYRGLLGAGSPGGRGVLQARGGVGLHGAGSPGGWDVLQARGGGGLHVGLLQHLPGLPPELLPLGLG